MLHVQNPEANGNTIVNQVQVKYSKRFRSSVPTYTLFPEVSRIGLVSLGQL